MKLPPHIWRIFSLSAGSGFREYDATAFANWRGRFLTSMPMDDTPEPPSSSMLSRRNRSVEFKSLENPRASS